MKSYKSFGWLVVVLAVAGCKKLASRSANLADDGQTSDDPDAMAAAAAENFSSGKFAPPKSNPQLTTVPWSQLKSKTQLMAGEDWSSDDNVALGLAKVVSDPGSVASLGKNMTPVRNQGKEGKCTAFGLTAAMEILIKGKTGTNISLSPEHLWSKYAVTYTDDALEAAKINLIATEKDWPYNTKEPDGIDKKGKYLLSQIRRIPLSSIHSALAQGHPVLFNFNVGSTIHRIGSDGWIVPDLNDKDNPYGIYGDYGHTTIIWYSKKYDQPVRGSKGFWGIKNSWGTGFGQAGHMWMPYEYCDQVKKSESEYDRCDAFEIMAVTQGEPDDGKRNPAKKFDMTGSSPSSTRNSEDVSMPGSGVQDLKGICEQFDNGPPGAFVNGMPFCRTRKSDGKVIKVNSGACTVDWCLKNRETL